MKTSELEKILQQGRVPERPEGYWEEFTDRVLRGIRASGDRAARRKQPRAGRAVWRAWARPALGFGIAGICVLVGFMWGAGVRRGDSARDERQLAEMARYFQEIQALFPRQVEGIAIDEQGVHLRLAEAPTVPESPPIWVRVCGPKGCARFVTFSGQQIRVNGDVFEVLVDHRGDVLLVGAGMVWSSRQAAEMPGSYRIDASPLPAHS